MSRIFLCILSLLLLCAPLSAEQRFLQLKLNIKAELEGLSFQVQPTMIVKQSEDVTMSLLPEDEKGNTMQLKIKAKELGGSRVDIHSNLLVKMDDKTIEREFRFQTSMGYPGLFMIRDKGRQEFLEVELTPTLVVRDE